MKFCAVCQTAHARVFCAADQAFICDACDKKIHENKVSSRHERFPICALCDNEPAKIFCKNDDAYLCENCDAEIHLSNPLAARHERVPVTAITSERKADSVAPVHDVKVKQELPELAREATLENGESCQTGCCLAVKAEPESQVSVQNSAGFVSKGGDKELEAFLDWDGAILDLGLELDAFESEIMANNLSSADAVVPIVEPAESSCSGGSPLSVATKQESAGSPLYNVGVPALVQALVPGIPPPPFPVSQPAFVGHTVGPYGMTLAVNPMAAGWPATFGMPQDTLHVNREDMSTKENRHQSINRYREKKKRRVFEKTIRYQSRKAYAEIRPRIKGRFAKREEVAAMVASGVLDVSPASPTDLSDDLVVPVF